MQIIREPLNKSAAALSGSFSPTDRSESLEIHKEFLQVPNLNLEQNPSLTALVLMSGSLAAAEVIAKFKKAKY